MTSAPVKDVNSLMNFVGGKNITKTGGTTRADSFGDVMSRTRSGAGSPDSQKKTVTGRETGKAADAVRSRQEVVKPQEPVKEQTGVADAGKPEKAAEELSQPVEEAANEIVGEIAREFGVSEEEIERAMEVLGLSIYSLFEPASLTQLILQLEGGQDATVLLTDESLFANLQNVIAAVADLKAELANELEISPEELKTVLEDLQGADDQSDVDEAAAIKMDDEGIQSPETTAQAAEEKTPQITVEVKAGDETVKLTTDEKGNVTGAVETVPSELREHVTNEHAGGHEQKGNENSKKESEGTLHMGELQTEGLVQNKVQAAEVSFEQTTEVFSEQTREIMDQIMDYMRIQLKPGMDQLEMQLHPESLGTVHIQLSSKGGEITAQFHVQNETVKAAIESQMTSLQESLKDQGIKVEAVQVTVESHGFESNLWQGQGREENASSEQNKKSPRRINLNQLDGLFEEEADEEELLAARMMEANGNTVDYTA